MATVTWTGLDELKEALRNLPDHLAEQAGTIVDDAGERAMASMFQAYPPGPTGNLRRGLKKVDGPHGRYGAAVRVISSSPHAWMYENGTQARHYVTKHGKQHATGRMWGRRAPNPVVIPTAIRERRTMVRQLVDMVRAEGFTVSNAP